MLAGREHAHELHQRAPLLAEQAGRAGARGAGRATAIRRVAEAHRAYRREIAALAGKDIRIALDEWNYWYGAERVRRARHALLPAGRPRDRRRPPRALPQQRPLRHGQLRADRQRDRRDQDHEDRRPSWRRPAWCWPSTGSASGRCRCACRECELPLDVVAAWSADRRDLTIAIVNPTREDRTLALDLRGARLAGAARRFVIDGTDPLAHNAPGEPRAVDVRESSLGEAPAALEAEPSRCRSTCSRRAASRRP